MGDWVKGLVWILGLGFSVKAVYGPSSSLAAPPATPASVVVVDRLEASVNASMVLLSDVRKFRETLPLRAQLDPLFAGTSLASKGSSAADTEIVQFLINERIVSQQFSVNDSEVEQEINSIQANNRIDRQALITTLREQGFVFSDYFELIRASAAKRNLIDRDIRTKVTITDDDVRNYFYNHFAKSSATPLSYKVKIIVVSPKNYKTQAAAREVAERAVKEIRGGEPFEEVAKRISDDASARAGGDLGTMTEDQMSPLIRDQLRKLKIGGISDIIADSNKRLFILKLVDVTSSEGNRFEKMKEEIRNQLIAAEYQHQIFLWLERQRQNAFIHIKGESSVTALPGHHS